MRAKDFIKGELKGWTYSEIIWLGFCTVAVLAVSLLSRDSLLSLLGALTGIWCTIFTGKGKRTAFIFGIINVFFYSVISYKARYYGEVMLNSLYFLPMNFVGWFAWANHLDPETFVIEKNSLPLGKKWLVYGATALGIIIYGKILEAMGGSLPYIDSMSTVISVTAQVLSVTRLAEQWVLWIIVNAVTVVMWSVDFANGGENLAMIVMWSIYLLNGIIMLIKWKRELA